jgi:hypothetical protein
MLRNVIRCTTTIFILCGLFALCAFAQTVPVINASALVKLGDNVRYGSYRIIKIGEGTYQINDRDSRQVNGLKGALGVDIYLICGEIKALMIDLGND